mmetsp:Transcript_6201/g.14040  ORF Transcript_6201/g.14040 Transcript_6201/m.14040 type:complete len:225 (+) Transcript_6201:674-1348(+)
MVLGEVAYWRLCIVLCHISHCLRRSAKIIWRVDPPHLQARWYDDLHGLLRFCRHDERKVVLLSYLVDHPPKTILDVELGEIYCCIVGALRHGYDHPGQDAPHLTDRCFRGGRSCRGVDCWRDRLPVLFLDIRQVEDGAIIAALVRDLRDGRELEFLREVVLYLIPRDDLCVALGYLLDDLFSERLHCLRRERGHMRAALECCLDLLQRPLAACIDWTSVFRPLP